MRAIIKGLAGDDWEWEHRNSLGKLRVDGKEQGCIGENAGLVSNTERRGSLC